MMPTFAGYTTTGPALTGVDAAGKALFRHYAPVVRGVNVYILTDGTVTEVPPTGDWSNVAHALWGAHSEPVTTAEATLLTTAGYGAYLT